MTDLVKVRGDWHPEVLANGQTIAPGEPFEKALLDPLEDERLISEGIVIPATVTPAPLAGDALKARADELKVKGRTTMSADELREAVALAEAQQGQSSVPADDTQRIGAS